MLLPVFLALASTLQRPEQAPLRSRCDSSAERMAGLVHEAENLRDDSVWVSHRKQWGWNGREPIAPTFDKRVCRRAAAALVRDGHKEAAKKVAVVQVGKGYVAQPGDVRDLWIVLDRQFHVLARVTVPS
jgi:hypothetical protein